MRERVAALKQKCMRPGQHRELRSWNLGGDPPQVDGWHDRVLAARGRQGRRIDLPQLPIVAVAAEPGVLSRHLRVCRGGWNIEVVRDLSASAGGHEAVEEPVAFRLAVGWVELVQDVLVRG